MNFAGKEDFPQSNSTLGAGGNTNTHDLAIFRYEEGIIAKAILTDEEVEELIKTRCLYIYVKARTTYPLRLDVKSPFLTTEQMAQKEDEEIELINVMLRERLCLKRVSRETVLADVDVIIDFIKEDIFSGFPYVTRLIVRNTKERLDAEASIDKQINDALKE